MNKKSKVNLKIIRMFFFLMVVSWLGLSCRGGEEQVETYLAESAEVNLESISMLPVAKDLSGGDVDFTVGFKNKGTTPVKVLEQFKPLPVFFSLNIEREDGTPVIVPGAGKISFFEGSIKCRTLNPGETHSFEFKLSDVLPRGLEKGKYKVSVSYHNQYGESCLKGKIESEPIEFEVNE